jgi:DNA-binding NtrC family response regulator
MKPEPANITCQSSQMRVVVEVLEMLASKSTPVLLIGEDGTGKSRLARLLVLKGPRVESSLVEVAYEPTPTETIQEDLFNADSGALLGANGGTMLIDELRSLPLAAQDELLAYLSTHKLRGIDSDVRIVLLSHVTNLEELRALVSKGLLRPQFLQEPFSVIAVPALRDRREELPLLCQDILDEEAEIWSIQQQPKLSPDALTALVNYHWPKNTSELKKTLKRALRASKGETILLEHLPVEVRSQGRSSQ